MAQYHRIIPRDLFNEAKLLKCLAALTVAIHDGKAGRLRSIHNISDNRGFVIARDDSDGSLYCENLKFYLNHTEIVVSTAMNSRKPYPLYALTLSDEEIPVLCDAGLLSGEFEDYLTTITPQWRDLQAEVPGGINAYTEFDD